MPIHPDDRHRYPANWREIRDAVLTRAQGFCECQGECGLHRGRRCREQNRTEAKFANGRIVLTVAHLDHQPENCDPSNLKAMCQKCHLRYDRHHHRRSRFRRSGRRAATGVQELSLGEN